MAAQHQSAQMSLRISRQGLNRIRAAADASGDTLAGFVRGAAADRCALVESVQHRQGPPVSPRGGDARAGDTAPAPSNKRLTRTERRVLAAVTRHAAVSSVAGAAEAAGLSWSATRGALTTLAGAGAIRQRTWTQSWRHGVRTRRCWEPAAASRAFQRLWPQARHIMLPAAPTSNVHVGRLPPQFWSLFWNHPDPSELSLPEDGDYIANRLLNGPSALAALWASVHLPVDALRACRALRSTRTHTRDLIDNAIAHRPTGPP